MLKRFTGTFCRAQILKLGGVKCEYYTNIFLGENMENAFIYCITNIWFNRAVDCQIICSGIGFSIFCPWYDSLQDSLEIYFQLNGT